MKPVLIIVPFDNIYPPMNGGMQRWFHVIHQLAKYFKLTLVTLQSKEGFLLAADEFPALRQLEIYSTKALEPAKDVFSLLPLKLQKALRYRWYKKTLKGSADGSLLQYYPLLIKLMAQNKYHAIVLENMATLNAVSIIRKYDKKAAIVFDAHNVDSKLAATAVEKGVMKKKHQVNIYHTESSLYKKVDYLLACSANDLEELLQMNSYKLSGTVIPNGVNLSNNLFDGGVLKETPEYILFCGALWSPPNSEGLFWFYNDIWPLVKETFPSLHLLVVGSGRVPPDMESVTEDSSVYFTGAVDDVKPWYNKASVAIVPLLRGSGTRLKILEAMNLGLPVISTSKGAEGLDYTHGENIIIADKENEFAYAVIQLLNNKERRLLIRKSAREMVVKKYDWNVIGKKMATFIAGDE